MKNIVSFSLWGNNTLYLNGAVKNVTAYAELFPEWKCRFYHDDSVPEDIVQQLKNLGAELYKCKPLPDVLGMYWRFLAIDDPTINYCMIRDADSLPTMREKYAVNEWIDSGQPFHIMRDNESHTTAILGGMWGCVSGLIKPSMKEHISSWFTILKPVQSEQGKLFHGTDQMFLESIIWPKIKNTHIAHIRPGMPQLVYTGAEYPFPTEYSKEEGYIGQVR